MQCRGQLAKPSKNWVPYHSGQPTCCPIIEQMSENGTGRSSNRLCIVHGNKEEEARHVTLRLALHPDRLEIRTQDEARGFDTDSVLNPLTFGNLFKPSGRGIHLMFLASLSNAKPARS